MLGLVKAEEDETRLVALKKATKAFRRILKRVVATIVSRRTDFDVLISLLHVAALLYLKLDFCHKTASTSDMLFPTNFDVWPILIIITYLQSTLSI